MNGMFLQLAIIPFLIIAIDGNSPVSPEAATTVFLYPPKFSSQTKWGKLEKCPKGQVVIGMQIKTKPKREEENGVWLNGLQFFCSSPRTSKPPFTFLWSDNYPTIRSLAGENGNWGETAECEGVMTGFQLTGLDMTIQDSASKNLILICTFQGTEAQDDLTEPKNCPSGKAVCGLQTQVKEQENPDTSSLINFGVKCC